MTDRANSAHRRAGVRTRRRASRTASPRMPGTATPRAWDWSVPYRGEPQSCMESACANASTPDCQRLSRDQLPTHWELEVGSNEESWESTWAACECRSTLFLGSGLRQEACRCARRVVLVGVAYDSWHAI